MIVPDFRVSSLTSHERHQWGGNNKVEKIKQASLSAPVKISEEGSTSSSSTACMHAIERLGMDYHCALLPPYRDIARYVPLSW
eukprot:gene5150-3700_t